MTIAHARKSNWTEVDVVMQPLRNWLMVVGILIAVLPSQLGWSQPGGRPELRVQTGKVPQSNTSNIDWNAPLPSASELKQRVLANLKKSEVEQERYVCKTSKENAETDKKGNVKKSRVEGRDMFFVNGQEIDELTSINGKPLNADQQKKEADRVKKEIQKDSDVKYVAKKDADDEKQVNMLLHMLRYANGHRVDRGGRSTLAYDLSGDPSVHPKSVEETFLHNMTGTIEVDEQTGELVDLNARLEHDVKIGGGLLANLHKGFWIHVRLQSYPGGVWLPKLVEGNGDARAALLFHPYFKFRDTINGCALTSVTTSQGASSIAK